MYLKYVYWSLTSEDSCFKVCVKFLLASARARVSSFGFFARGGSQQGALPPWPCLRGGSWGAGVGCGCSRLFGGCCCWGAAAAVTGAAIFCGGGVNVAVAAALLDKGLPEDKTAEGIDEGGGNKELGKDEVTGLLPGEAELEE